MLKTSRRDDLISLCYMMSYLLHGELPFEAQNDLDWNEEFLRIRAKKMSLRPEDLCHSSDSIKLLTFIKEIFSLKFEEAPYYDKLRFMLATILTEYN